MISQKLKPREEDTTPSYSSVPLFPSLSIFIVMHVSKLLFSFDFSFLLYCFKTNKHYSVSLLYSNALVTFENSPFSSFVCQKIGFVSMKPCLTQPASLTWYKLM